MTTARLVHRMTSAAQSTLLFVLPHGGQQLARRNAWAAMSVDASRARARREATAALALAGGAEAVAG